MKERTIEDKENSRPLPPPPQSGKTLLTPNLHRKSTNALSAVSTPPLPSTSKPVLQSYQTPLQNSIKKKQVHNSVLQTPELHLLDFLNPTSTTKKYNKPILKSYVTAIKPIQLNAATTATTTPSKVLPAQSKTKVKMKMTKSVPKLTHKGAYLNRNISVTRKNLGVHKKGRSASPVKHGTIIRRGGRGGVFDDGGDASINSSVRSPLLKSDYEKHLSKTLLQKTFQISLLLIQLASANIIPNLGGKENVVSLECATEKMKAALEGVMSGNDDDGEFMKEYEKWDAYISNHPTHISNLIANELKFKERNKQPNEEACERMKSYVPNDVFVTTLASLKERVGEGKLAERIWQKKILWLTRLPKPLIKKLHIAELLQKYQPINLDVLELRAVCHCIPETFENDADGSKEKWGCGIWDKLKREIAKGGEERNKEYDKWSEDKKDAYELERDDDSKVNEEIKIDFDIGPFDPNAPSILPTLHLSTSIKEDPALLCINTKTNKELLRRNSTFDLVKEEGEVERIDAIGSVKCEGNKNFMSSLSAVISSRSSVTEGKAPIDTGRESESDQDKQDDFKSLLENTLKGKSGGAVKSTFLDEIKAVKEGNKKEEEVSASGSKKLTFLEEIAKRRTVISSD